MKAVLLRGNVISEIFQTDKAGLTSAALYHPDFVASLTDLPDTVVLGKYWINGEMIDSLPPKAEDVQLERNTRMSVLTFNGKEYDIMGQSLNNVMGAGTLALAAIMNGAQPNDLRWSDANTDFQWIANDNSFVPMDAQTTWAFATAAAEWRKKMIYAARALKDMDPIPMDFASNNSYWGV